MPYLSKIIQLDQTQFTKLLSGQSISQNGNTINSYDSNALYVFDKFVPEWALGSNRAVRADKAIISTSAKYSHRIKVFHVAYHNSGTGGHQQAPLAFLHHISCSGNNYYYDYASIKYNNSIYFDYDASAIVSPYFKMTAPEMNVQTSFDRVYVSNDSVIRWKSKDRFIAEIIAVGSFDNRFVLKAGDTMSGTLIFSGIATSNWTEGIRINNATNGWTTLTMGGTATSGTGANIWSFHTYQGNFYLAKNGSSSFDTGLQNVSGNWMIKSTGIETLELKSKSSHTGLVINSNASSNPFTRFKVNGTCYAEHGYSTSKGTYYIGAYNTDNGIINIHISNQRVGIGTYTPSYKLHVVGNSLFALGGNLYPSSGADFSNGYSFNIVKSDSETYGLHVAILGSGCSLLQSSSMGSSYYDMSLNPLGGNVGIGTTAPTEKFDVNGDIRIRGNDEYLGTGSGSQCHMQYDNTNKCLNFIFD